MVIAVGSLMVLTGNAIVTVRLWRSQMYERSQQIAQTALMWALPGAALVVNWFLREPVRKGPEDDPTYSNDGATNYGLQGVNVHGDPPSGP